MVLSEIKPQIQLSKCAKTFVSFEMCPSARRFPETGESKRERGKKRRSQKFKHSLLNRFSHINTPPHIHTHTSERTHIGLVGEAQLWSSFRARTLDHIFL